MDYRIVPIRRNGIPSMVAVPVADRPVSRADRISALPLEARRAIADKAERWANYCEFVPSDIGDDYGELTNTP